jgi:hypothetical protein
VVGEPFKDGSGKMTRELAVTLFHMTVMAENDPHAAAWREQMRTELRGHDLACWCPPDGQPCHVDVLLKVANS